MISGGSSEFTGRFRNSSVPPSGNPLIQVGYSALQEVIDMTSEPPSGFAPIEPDSAATEASTTVDPLASGNLLMPPEPAPQRWGTEGWRAYPALVPGFDEDRRLMRFWTAGDPQVAIGHLVGQLQAYDFRITPNPDGYSGSAEVGSAAKRALLGGFARRNKLEYRLSQSPVPEQFILEVQITMTGAGGGAIGYTKAKRENRDLYGAIWNTLHHTGVVVYPSAVTLPE